jgi:RNA polymerase sigma-70 factor, ECF subfamily
MTGMSDPAEAFEPYRGRLLGLAYRMLGSMADAEDAVQETYLRWHGFERATVSDPRAFLMTTTTRICLDMLTSARARREEYLGACYRSQLSTPRSSLPIVALSWLRIYRSHCS